MADRYWVGGSGTWNTSSTTNWSANSGGSGGASVPTAADRVFFDQAGTYTVTMTGALACDDFTVSAGTVTFATGSGPTLAISGSLSLVGATVWSTTAAITFNSTLSETITTNGVALTNSNLIFNGIGGSWTLGSALTTSVTGGIITLTAGTLTTSASNYNITVQGITITANTDTKVLTLNGSTVTLGGRFVNNSTGNFTLNAGTSTITFASSFNGASYGAASTQSLTFYNMTISVNTGAIYTAYLDAGANTLTFNNFTLGHPSASIQYPKLFIYSNITINGTFTTTGGGATAPWLRWQVYSNIPGTNRTITAAVASLADVDFVNITGAGTATWSGTRLGNAGGNTGITFVAGKTVYLVSTAASVNYDSALWATSSNGTTAATNFPLPQDTAVFDNSSAATNGTVTFGGGGSSGAIVGTLTTVNRTNGLIIGFTSSPRLVSNLTLSSAITGSGTGSSGFFTGLLWDTTNCIGYMGTTTQTITPNSGSLTVGICVINPNATVTLAANFTSGTTVNSRINAGTLNLNGKVLTTGGLTISTSNTKTLAFGAAGGQLALANNNATILSITNTTGLTITGTTYINCTYTGATGTRTLDTSGFTESNALSFSVGATSGITCNTTSTDTLTLTGSYLNVTTTNLGGTFGNGTRTIFGNLTIGSTTTLAAGTAVTTFGSTSGTDTITSNGKTLDFPITFNGAGGTWQLSGALTVGSTRTTTLTAGTLTLNGANLSTGIFSSVSGGTRAVNFGTNSITITGNNATVLDLGSGTYTFTGTQFYNLTYTGATGTRTISLASSLYTEANALSVNTTGTSGVVVSSTATDTVTLSGIYNNISLGSFVGTFGNATRTVFGNFTIGASATVASGNLTTTFGSTSGTDTITTNGKTLDFPVTFSGNGGTWQLSGNMTVGSTRTVSHTAGTIALNGANLSTGFFGSTGNTTRSISFGTNSITITGNNGNVLNLQGGAYAATGTPFYNLTYTGGTGTRTIATTASFFQTEANTMSLNTTGTSGIVIAPTATDTLNMSGGYNNINFTSFGGTFFVGGSTTAYGSLTIGTGTTVAASTQSLTFAATSGTKDITSNGKTLDFPINFNGVGGTWRLIDAVTVGSTRNTILSNGTLNLNAKTLTIGTFFINAGTKDITFNNGSIVVTGTGNTWNNANPTGLTFTAGTGAGTISLTNASAKTFVGGNFTYPCTVSNNGAGTMTITGSNTITTLANGVQPTAFVFPASGTTTVTNFNLQGTAGNLVTMSSSSAGTRSNISKSSGTVNAQYLSITDINATGGATWKAYTNGTTDGSTVGNVSGGNNQGWTFIPPGMTFAMFFQ